MPGVGVVAGELCAVAGPRCPGILEDSALRANAGIIVQGTGGDDGNAQIWRHAGHEAAADTAEYSRKTLCFRNFEVLETLIARCPIDACGLYQDIAGVPGARGFSASFAVAVPELTGLATDFVPYGAAEAAAGQGNSAHSRSPISHLKRHHSGVPGFAAMRHLPLGRRAGRPSEGVRGGAPRIPRSRVCSCSLGPAWLAPIDANKAKSRDLPAAMRSFTWQSAGGDPLFHRSVSAARYIRVEDQRRAIVVIMQQISKPVFVLIG